MWRTIAVHLVASTLCATLLGIVWGLLTASFGPHGAAYSRWLITGSPVGHAMIGGFTYACVVGTVLVLDARRRAQQTELSAAWLARDAAVAREQAIKMQVH